MPWVICIVYRLYTYIYISMNLLNMGVSDHSLSYCLSQMKIRSEDNE